MTTAVLLRSRMTRKCHVRFWRAEEGVTPSLTLILNAAKIIAALAVPVNAPEIPGIACQLEGQMSLFPIGEIWDKAPSKSKI